VARGDKGKMDEIDVERPYSVKVDDVMGWMTYGPGVSAMSYLMAYTDDDTKGYPNIYCHNLNVAFRNGREHGAIEVIRKLRSFVAEPGNDYLKDTDLYKWLHETEKEFQ